MACLKRLLPAGYSGYSQIPAQSRSRSLPRWTKPPPPPGALLQTFINPFVLCVVSFEALNLARRFLWERYIYKIFFSLNSLVRSLLAATQSHPWLGGEARGSVAPARAWLAPPACSERMHWHREQGGRGGSPLPPCMGTRLRPGQDLTLSASYPLPGLGWTPALERPCLRKAIASISIWMTFLTFSLSSLIPLCFPALRP